MLENHTNIHAYYIQGYLQKMGLHRRPKTFKIMGILRGFNGYKVRLTLSIYLTNHTVRSIYNIPYSKIYIYITPYDKIYIYIYIYNTIQ